MDSTPHVAVVGGGVTGTGIARDLAMRGLDVTLFEAGPLTSGATGRMHALLHSGARYAVTDADGARQCIAENRVLRGIAGHCISPTGGLFVQREDEDEAYFERKLAACEACDIPVEELSAETLQTIEPALADDVVRGLRVPDATVDPFALTAANATAAHDHGARIETHTEVTGIVVEDGRVRGVELGSERTARSVDYLVNATGAWAGRVAGLAGLDVPLRLSRGAMSVVADRPVERVINRCRPRDEGDIVVPFGSHAILGATDREVADPDPGREEGESDRLLAELAPVVPALADAEPVGTYWGVRPLYSPDAGKDETSSVTRDFVVLDHGARDDLAGMATVLGGKLTTYRLMAERTGDLVCEVVGIDRPSRTAETPLPDPSGRDEPTATTFDLSVPRSLSVARTATTGSDPGTMDETAPDSI